MRCVFAVAAFLVVSGCSSEAPADDAKPAQPEKPLAPEDDPEKKGHLFSVLSHDQEENVALAINLSGNLCGKFVGAEPAGASIIAECQEYRKKPGHYVRYYISGLGDQQALRVEKFQVLKPSGWQRVTS